MTIPQVLDQYYLANSLRNWLFAALIAAALFLILLVARRVLVARLGVIAARTTNKVDDLLVELLARTRSYVLLFAAIAVASRWLVLPARFDHGLSVTIAFSALKTVDIDVTPLITGLGISGIAVALAVQNILGDLFAALAIVFDRPFDVGDTIVVDQITGTVEHIGLKTTRLRSISGEQVIMGNADLLKSRLHNMKRMYQRRVAFTVDLMYDTPPETLARVPAIMNEIVSAQSPVRFDRSHVATLGESAIRVETVYFVLDPDYVRAMDIQHAVNLQILRRLRSEGIKFAFPTRTVVLAGDDTRGEQEDGRTGGREDRRTENKPGPEPNTH